MRVFLKDLKHVSGMTLSPKRKHALLNVNINKMILNSKIEEQFKQRNKALVKNINEAYIQRILTN